MKNKIFFLLALFSLVLIISGCNKSNGTPETKKDDEPNETKELLIDYYDGSTIVAKKIYTDIDSFVLFEYQKEDLQFVGWYLDQNLTNEFDISKIKEYFEMEKMQLYAKFTLIPNNYQIDIEGNIESAFVNNPLFKWDNPYKDKEFNVLIKDASGEEYTDTTTNTYYLASLLKFDTEYEFTVTGKTSQNTSKVSFKTIPNNNYVQTSNVVLDNPYMSNMVIQRDEDIIISGVGPQQALISVNFDGEIYFGISNSEGKFSVNVGKKYASFTPITISVGEKLPHPVTLTNVLIGDVFLFAGQSNMQWPTTSSDYLDDDVTTAASTDVRFFSQNVTTSPTPVDYVQGGKWFSVKNDGKGSVLYYSSIAFMSGSMISFFQTADNVPIGILSAYQGDTNIANWMSDEYYKGSCGTKYLHYNAMIYPLRNAKIKGVVWYQGCNNSAAGGDYEELLGNFFKNYRDLFGNENLPFYVIGLACYDGDPGNNYDFSYVRESQAKACEADPNAYFISTCDDGDPTYIHPSKKRYICERITKCIESTLYGRNFLSGGPTYLSNVVDGDTMTISFENADGLYSTGAINNIYLAGEDGKYYEASAQIVNDKLVVKSNKVSNPVYVKYGFGKSPFVNIFNKQNYSMVPFRTDDHNLNIDLLDYNSTSKYKFHPDGSKMNIELVGDELKITKTNDGKTYGSVRLEKWGMISYDAVGFNFTLTGSNSGATIAFRIIEGPSNELWSYKIVDNFEGKRTYNLTTSDFTVALNKKDNILDTQCISYIEIMVESPHDVTFKVSEARFVEYKRSAPKNFTISDALQGKEETTILLNKSAFADEYEVFISLDGENYTNPVYHDTITSTSFTVKNSIFDVGELYYVKAIAKNELGSTVVSNVGLSFYVNDPNKLIINNFDYTNQASLDAYINAKMDIHSNLSCTLAERGIKISSKGGGWLQFIFKLETGSNVGFNKLVFYADFTNYKGTVEMQLANSSYQTYNYTLDISTMKSGIYEINFSDFIKNGAHFTSDNIMWVMFNFANSVSGDEIILDDVCYMK